MEALVSNVYPTSDLATVDSSDPHDDLVAFSRKPSDSRFLSNNFVILSPNEPITKDIQEVSFSQSRSVLPIYTSLNEIYVSMTVSLVKKASEAETATSPVVDGDNIAPISFLPDAFWDTFDIYFNDTLVGCSHKYRHISAHLGRLLGFHKDALSSYCGTELGHVDGSLNGDETLSANKGFAMRKSTFLEKDGKAPKVHLLGLLTTDISSVGNLIIPNVDIRFRLSRNKDKKLLVAGKKLSTEAVYALGTKTFHLELHDVQLLFRRPLLSDSVFRKHVSLLNSGKPSIYEFYRSDVKYVNIPQGIKTFYSNDLFSSTSLPAKAFMVFFDEDRLNGDYLTSIQKYEKPPNLTYCDLELDMRPVNNFGTCINKTYESGLDAFQYLNLYNTSQTYYTNVNGPYIQFEEWKNNAFILTYDFTTSGFVTDEAYPLIKTGPLRLHMEFSKATSKSYVCLIFTSSPATLTIDNQRAVTLSYRNILQQG